MSDKNSFKYSPSKASGTGQQDRLIDWRRSWRDFDFGLDHSVYGGYECGDPGPSGWGSLIWDSNIWLWVLCGSNHYVIELQITDPYSRQKVFWALRIFGLKRNKVTWGSRKLHNKELRKLYSIPNMIGYKSRRREGHIACMGEKWI
jgi:hypothetical protein